MFTGIVEEMGKIARLARGADGARIEIAAAKVLEGTQVGDSICANGVCLTVAAKGADVFCADVMNETLKRSSFCACMPGDAVNLERALAPASRMGGHIVTGHIDATGRVEDVRRDGQAVWFSISVPPELSRYIVEKGSVAVDGTSLTVARADGGGFAVSCIPHTLETTVLQRRRPGDAVNIECDLLAKYVEKLLGAPRAGGRADGSAGGDAAGVRSLDLAFLADNGFI